VDVIGELPIDIRDVAEAHRRKKIKLISGGSDQPAQTIDLNIVTSIGDEMGMLKIAANGNRKNVGIMILNYTRE